VALVYELYPRRYFYGFNTCSSALSLQPTTLPRPVNAGIHVQPACGTARFAHSICGTIEFADGPDTTKENAINVLIHSKKHLARRLLLLLLLLLLVSIGGGWWVFATRPSLQAAELAAARARWQARPFTTYRLTLTRYEPGPPGGCQQDLIIRDEQVAEVIRDACQRYRDPMTVSDLFASIESDPQHITMMSGLDPCQVGNDCRRVREVQVVYDPVLGYPRTLRVTEQNRPNWWHPFTWQHILEHGSPPDYPMLGGSFDQHIVVESLTPLPSP